ncbi:LuxR C-terminal-related transcriptional regulator [Enteractinococcus fodinae]|uniref:ATP/maltotriose-dependent transcriptional regulator MalT n=1 Tax=Enteractinococcus fodinae TaxID=684663 RepID=A0ABU2B2I1_9MICC|nr:response regulator transcription factor [Enteractinococcus fodinae]MDR7346584.1 ATP/maltotriose-dependent transcriptional regulator MalT [Enteractinococcus fodinae]
MNVVKALHRAREAYERREWLTAYKTLSDLDNAALAATDFIRLADTAELLGHSNDAVQALQRAHLAALGAGEPIIAARATARLAMLLALRGETAVAGGWLATGERLLEEIGDDVVEQGYLLVARMLERVGVGDLETAAKVPPQIIACARRHGDANLLAIGLNQQGRILTVLGQLTEGVRFLDEAMTGIVSGEVDDPLFAGEVYCSMIEACQWIGDWGRAAQWTRALTTWCSQETGLVAFTGQCAVHRAQLMRFNGAFDDAVIELERAVERYEAVGNRAAMALVYTERGDVLRLMGDLEGADEAYAAAVLHGSDAQLGRALVSLSRGNIDRAVSAVRRVLVAVQGDIFRHRIIPACVEVLLAAGRIEEAAALADELAVIAQDYGSTAVGAAASVVAAQVGLARGDAEAALPAAKAALHSWLDLEAAYQVARSRVLIGRALQLMGDDEGAALELRTALAAFESQGALADAHDVTQRLGGVNRPGGLTEREVEVLRLVAAGRSNAQIADDLHLSIKTVARHLSNIFTKLDVSSRTQAAAVARRYGVV